ncbi:MAG: 4'-phosphopantetheinyl transferase superfamily protein [Deltaproteobacteria bacterium]|nr:4'-phosphopantetheinyl transferase superfamily protein [Deltaproteobacteria bacterium]
MDLREPRNLGKSGDTRFLERVFTAEECRLIRAAKRPDAVLWAFWACKEAAYKAVSKTHPAISSRPRRYKVLVDEKRAGEWLGDQDLAGQELAGWVATPAGIVLIRVTLGNDYVHCLAADQASAPETDHWLAEEMDPMTAASPEGPSRHVRTSASRAIAACLGLIPENISIHRFAALEGLGPPVVFLKGRPAGFDISLSHDGRFAAWAFIRSN